MRKRIPHWIVVLVFMTSGGSVRAADPADLRPVIEPVREKFKVPGVAAAVVRDGKTVAVGASGVRDLSSKEPVASGDRSLIGSCGKSATRLLIGRLVDRGLLKWDSTLGELLSDGPMKDEYKPVTVGDIIGHRGGLQPYTMISPNKTPILFNQSGSPREQRAAFIAHLLMEAPSAPPRTKFVYSNAGYGLLGHIAERLADKSYEQLMRDEVFRPLGMNSAIIGGPSDATSVAGWSGHTRSAKGFEPAPPRQGLAGIAPAGMMSMSIEDFAKLAAALVQVESRKPSEFLIAKAVDKLPELRPGSAGEGEVFLGGDGHYTAAFALWPSKGVGVVVETNAGDSDSLCEALVEAVRVAAAPETKVDGGSAPAGGQRPRFGFQIQAEAGEDTWTVIMVEADSPAERGGLKKDDRIVAIGGTPLGKLEEEARTMALRKSPLALRVQRGGETVDLTLRLP